ncbi:S53 family peptidase [Fodinicola feengrottensis]|uniref:Peptidase S8 n=1 Tax=Fodinicola feengrottensis TaxID=435914 RepID=A0ABN2FSC7_9ACTN|nr:S8 family serine peptidase [Fodinicola feengrottensis]
MTRKTLIAFAFVAVLSAAVPANAAPAPAGTVGRTGCAVVQAGRFHCFADIGRSPAKRAARTSALPAGLGPADIASAYQLPANVQPNSLVAVVDAYDNPNAEADLAVYRQTYGLPACTSASGCFSKVNQRGAATPLPTPDPNWGVETSLDLDAVSASCPSCRILLVEADSSLLSPNDLAASVDTAVALGAHVVSNSYGSDESPSMGADAGHYQHPGTAMVASAGDSGFTTASFPAVLSSTIAVGGTTLSKAAGSARGWTETAWSHGGSGCSAYVSKPSWQHDKHCSLRTTADLSAVADPATGLAVYDTFGLINGGGFIVVGGTSASAPLVAGMIARSGHVITDAQPVYAHPSAFFDVVGGSNGFCGGDYLCTGKRGYDAPTGIGSPAGLSGL